MCLINDEYFIQGESPELVKVLLGPIVGKVSDSTAVVLLEMRSTAEIVAEVINERTGLVVQEVKRNCVECRPCGFFFEHLDSDTPYVVTFRGVHNRDRHVARFRTYQKRPASFRIAFVSGIAYGHTDLLDTHLAQMQHPVVDDAVCDEIQ